MARGWALVCSLWNQAAGCAHVEPVEAATGARALVVGTDWPLYRQVNLDRLAEVAPGLRVIDANRFLGGTMGSDPRFRLISVGQPRE